MKLLFIMCMVRVMMVIYTIMRYEILHMKYDVELEIRMKRILVGMERRNSLIKLITLELPKNRTRCIKYTINDSYQRQKLTKFQPFFLSNLFIYLFIYSESF